MTVVCVNAVNVLDKILRQLCAAVIHDIVTVVYVNSVCVLDKILRQSCAAVM